MFTASTFTPGMTAPDESLTVPEMLPVTLPRTITGANPNKAISTKHWLTREDRSRRPQASPNAAEQMAKTRRPPNLEVLRFVVNKSGAAWQCFIKSILLRWGHESPPCAPQKHLSNPKGDSLPRRGRWRSACQNSECWFIYEIIRQTCNCGF